MTAVSPSLHTVEGSGNLAYWMSCSFRLFLGAFERTNCVLYVQSVDITLT